VKAYLVSILLVGLALGGMGLGTFAWFTDTAAVDGNAISTGKVDLEVEIQESANGAQTVLTVENLVPSTDTWTTAGIICLKNVGTVPLKWKGYFVKTGGNLPLDDTLKFRIRQVTDGPLETAPKYSTWDDLKNSDGIFLNSSNFGGGGGQMDPGTQYYKVEVRLDENAGNAYAGKSATFRAVFDATQPENSGWSETS